MSLEPRVFVQNDEVIFEATYSWPEMLNVARHLSGPTEAISIDDFMKRLDEQLHENCDAVELFYEFLADASEEK
jgi:hypothetical protein